MQDYTILDIRSSAILTTSYVAGTVISPANVSPSLKNQLSLLVSFTIGSLASCQIRVEYSHNGSTWFQDTFEAISGGTATLTLGEYSFSASGNYVINIPIKFNYIRISAKGTGTVTNSSLSIQAIIGIV